MSEKRLTKSQRKEEILKAAIPLFAQKGLGATTKELACRACVSEALLYKHFPSKAALFEEIKSSCCKKARESGHIITALPSSSQVLIMAIYGLVRFVLYGATGDETHNNTKRILAHGLLQDRQFIKNFFETNFEDFMPKLEDCMKVAIEAGEMIAPSENLKLSLWLSHHLCFGVSIIILNQNEDLEVIDYGIDPQGLQIEISKFIMRGLGLKQEIIEQYFMPEEFNLILENPSTLLDSIKMENS
ncbi:MAG: TetR/AcrR family transcriptional regulator [Bacteriovoracaceae bacterium]|jgi:TetR/AcrR family transcriptional regulator, transcriptional repressor of aconitase|nr:TetR/AcrR family transcriptional regulator [Bacteriovoracaceae bacterium]